MSRKKQLMSFTREQLHDRHWLSHQQVDRWLGENSGNRFLDEKIRQLEKVKKFLAVCELMKQNDISFINIKGPLLSYRLYGDSTVRLSYDFDFLIDIKDIDKVVDVFFKNGYHFYERIVWSDIKAERDLLILSMHHLVFHNLKTNLFIEVHWLLSEIFPVSFKKQKKIINDNIKSIEFGGQTHKYLDNELELVHLILHGTIHGWSRLKWLVDIADYPVEKIDEQKFNKLVKQFNAERSISETNYMLKTFFDKQLPFSGAKHLPKYLIRFAFNSIENEYQTEKSFFKQLKKQKNYFLMFSRPYYKARVIWGAFFRNRQEFFLTDVLYRLIYIFYLPYNYIKRRILHAG